MMENAGNDQVRVNLAESKPHGRANDR